MSDHKENWRKYYPPMIPIYFMDYDALKDMLEKNPMSVNNEGLEMMLGYFEEYEKYEKAALVRDAQWSRGMFAEQTNPSRTLDKGPKVEKSIDQKRPAFPPPDDGHDWTLSEDGTHWVRKATPEENRKFLNNQTDVNKDEQDENKPRDGDNPFQ